MLSTLEADRALVTTLEAQNLDLRVDVDLKRSLSALRIEQALAQERLDSYKYPVLTLPNEILCEIFERFLPPYPLCPPLTGNLSPTFLTQICRKWRQVALATPTLWRAITLSFYRIPFERQGQISDFLTRSGSCPLSIRNDDIGLSEPIAEVFSTVALHRARWEYLYLSLSPWQLPSINGPMPLLRHLRLSVNNPEEAGAIAFRDMPLLPLSCSRRVCELERQVTVGATDLPDLEQCLAIGVSSDFAGGMQPTPM
ncbi:F-box domain-containing protein [Mycena venus]|uniref:F-box domain-containing protein n=1 Tax=Mycena venus TaxID=2733690 RepID=A0A8H6X4W8_9AGAR|nr:F-box domain-containing protein [Mycena venus]